MKLTGFKALTIGCNGTLIDCDSGKVAGLNPLTRRMKTKLSRHEILAAHERHEYAQQMQTPGKSYREILSIVYRRLSEEWSIPVDWRECVAYGRATAEWPIFPDSPGALQYLGRYFKPIALSNLDNESFAGNNDKLQVEFDAVYTAEDVGAYMPSHRNFDYMLDKLACLGIEKHEILYTARCITNDLHPARSQGLSSCWIDRRKDREREGMTETDVLPKFDFHFNSLAHLAKAHQKTLRG